MLLGPPLAAFAQQQLSYAFVDMACVNRALVLVHLPALLSLALVAFAVVLARREWDRGGRQRSTANGAGTGFASFFAVVGFMVSGLALMLILAQWIPTLFLDPCQR
jgi:hypothetical protein